MYSPGRSKCYRRLTQSGDFLIADEGVTSGASELEHPSDILASIEDDTQPDAPVLIRTLGDYDEEGYALVL